MSIKASPFAGPLTQLRTTPGVVQALVTAPDGFLVASAIEVDETVEVWAAVAAVFGKLGTKFIEAHQQTTLTHAVFYAMNYSCIVMPVSIGLLLAVTTPEAALESVCDRVFAVVRELETAVEGIHSTQGLERSTHV